MVDTMARPQGLAAASIPVPLVSMSNISEDGINSVMQSCCDRLLAHRVEIKLTSSKRLVDVVNRMHIARPEPRDGKARSVSIPAAVLAQRQQQVSLSDDSMGSGHSFTASSADAEDDGDYLVIAGARVKRQRMPDGRIRALERDLEMLSGGPGVFDVDLKKRFMSVFSNVVSSKSHLSLL